jgi:hypothetical protein
MPPRYSGGMGMPPLRWIQKDYLKNYRNYQPPSPPTLWGMLREGRG